MKGLATMCLKCLNCFQIEQEQIQRHQKSSSNESENIEFTIYQEVNQEPTTNSVRSSFTQQKQKSGNAQEDKRQLVINNAILSKKNYYQDQSTDNTISNISPEISQDFKNLQKPNFFNELEIEENVNLQKQNEDQNQNKVKSQLIISICKDHQNTVYGITSPNISFSSDINPQIEPNTSFNQSLSQELGQIIYTFESEQQIYKQNDFCMQTPEEWSQLQSHISTPNSQVDISIHKKINNSDENSNDQLQMRKQLMQNNAASKRNKKIEKILLSKLSETPKEVFFQKYLCIQSTQSHKKIIISPNNKYLFPQFQQQNNSVSLLSQDAKLVDTLISESNQKLCAFTQKSPHLAEMGSMETIKSGSNQESVPQFQESQGFNSTRGVSLLPIIFELQSEQKPRKQKRQKSDGALQIWKKQKNYHQMPKKGTQLGLFKSSSLVIDIVH